MNTPILDLSFMAILLLNFFLLAADRLRAVIFASACQGVLLGVAFPLAANRKAAILVLDSPFSSAVDVAAVHYRMLPVRWLMFDQFRSDLAIRDVRIPVLIVHGDEDRVIPISLAKRLFERANEPKEFISVAGGGHLVLGLTEVFVRVREWIDTKTMVKRHSDITAANKPTS